MAPSSINQNEIVLRPVTQDDIEIIQDLLRSAWHKTYDKNLGPEKVAQLSQIWHSSDRLTEDINNLHCRFLVATLKNQICATILLSDQGNDVILSRMYVHPKAQNKGLGTTIMQTIMTTIGEDKLISLTVEPTNTSAIEFYQKFGFIIKGQGSNSKDPHDDIPTLIMERPVKTG